MLTPVLTASSLSISGVWQGIYLWEHRHQAGEMTVVVHID